LRFSAELPATFVPLALLVFACASTRDDAPVIAKAMTAAHASVRATEWMVGMTSLRTRCW
jgi:hypothetical protein